MRWSGKTLKSILQPFAKYRRIFRISRNDDSVCAINTYTHVWPSNAVSICCSAVERLLFRWKWLLTWICLTLQCLFAFALAHRWRVGPQCKHITHADCRMHHTLVHWWQCWYRQLKISYFQESFIHFFFFLHILDVTCKCSISEKHVSLPFVCPSVEFSASCTRSISVSNKSSVYSMNFRNIFSIADRSSVMPGLAWLTVSTVNIICVHCRRICCIYKFPRNLWKFQIYISRQVNDWVIKWRNSRETI